MNYIVIFLTTALCFNGFCQSKKEQIAILNYRLDSLGREYDKDTTALNEDLRNLNHLYSTLKEKQKEAEYLIDKKSNTIKNKNEKIQDYIAKNKELQIELNKLRTEVKKTQFHEVEFPQEINNKLWSIDCDPESKDNIYFGTRLITEGDQVSEMVEIGGYEWGGDVLRTEVNENKDYFKVYFVRTDSYEHDNKLEIFEFQWMNKQLIVDNAQMIPCVKGSEVNTNEKKDYRISNDILKYGLSLEQLNDPSYISSYYPMPDFNRLNGVTDGDIVDGSEISVGERGWLGRPANGIRYYSDSRNNSGDLQFFTDTLKNGPYLSWTENGTLQDYIFYKDDVMNGYKYSWNENGKLTFMTFFDGKAFDGKALEQGERIGWHDNGQISLKAQFADGKANGRWVSYYENGIIEKEGENLENKKIGKWIHRDERGESTCVVNWIEDEPYAIVDRINLSCNSCLRCYPYAYDPRLYYIDCYNPSMQSIQQKTRGNNTMSYQIGFGSKKYDLKVEYIKGSFEPEVFLNNKRLYNHSSYIVGNDSFIYEPSFLDGKIIVNEGGVSCSGCSISKRNN